MKANIHDRSSVERIYPPETFRQDAGRNSVGNAAILRGLSILSQPDADGAFEIAAVKRQTGERDPEGDTVFLPAVLRNDASSLQVAPASEPDRRGEGGAPGDEGRPDNDYAAYIDHVLEVARSVDFKSSIGADPRLAGFHGG